MLLTGNIAGGETSNSYNNEAYKYYAELGIKVLNYTQVGNEQDYPKYAVHLRKHKW
jgi:hypothetical protein